MTEIFDGTSMNPTEEQLRGRFNAALRELNFSAADLLHWMSKRGDYRDSAATMRSIQRMASGETRVSGEMMVLVNMLLRQYRRLNARHPNLVWQKNERGGYSTQIDGWYVYIHPKSKGRWLLECSCGPSREDFSPEWGRWLDFLEEAQNKALMYVEEGMADMAENMWWNKNCAEAQGQ